MFNLLHRNQRGFTLIELIVVIAIMMVLVTVAVPKFMNQTKDAKVAAMKTDTKVLSDAALMYNIDNPEGFPVADEAVEATGGPDNVGTLYEIDETKLENHIKGIHGEYSDYGIVTEGANAGEVYKLVGIEDKAGDTWFNEHFKVDAVTP